MTALRPVRTTWMVWVVAQNGIDESIRIDLSAPVLAGKDESVPFSKCTLAFWMTATFSICRLLNTCSFSPAFISLSADVCLAQTSLEHTTQARLSGPRKVSSPEGADHIFHLGVKHLRCRPAMPCQSSTTSTTCPKVHPQDRFMEDGLKPGRLHLGFSTSLAGNIAVAGGGSSFDKVHLPDIAGMVACVAQTLLRYSSTESPCHYGILLDQTQDGLLPLRLLVIPPQAPCAIFPFFS